MLPATNKYNLGRFYNLAAYPQYIPELRDEIRSVLTQHGDAFTSSALQAMKKLDSFIKETMRLYPPGLANFQRKVTKTITLSNGQVIPAGVVIQVPADAVARDPELFPNPDEFDPWRFSRLREEARGAGKAEEAAHHQFVSISSEVLTVCPPIFFFPCSLPRVLTVRQFGYGRHACPGRFFAANEIKMIIAQVILNFDMKLPDGVTERYPNIMFGPTVSVIMCFLAFGKAAG